MTPRKFKSQLDVYEDVQMRMNQADKSKETVKTGFIDQIPGW